MSRLNELVSEFGLVERRLGDPAALADPREYARLTRRHRELLPLVTLVREQKQLQSDLEGARELLHDPDMRELAQAEAEGVQARLTEIESELELLLLPTDPDDAKDVILELRAGAGGAEAGLFVMDLLRLYERYAAGLNLKLSVLDAAESDLGGASKVVAEVSGDFAFRAFKWERGVHRVQRVPATESQGRIHTSTATVAVLPEAEPGEVTLDLSEVRIDVFRSQGAGGQGVNTTDSAVRAVYRAGTPDEIMVVCQDGRSQIKNREKALQVLTARLAERERANREAQERQDRAAQVGSGDRSEKVRTYNYPQNRVTDHRLEGDDKNHPLDSVMGGALAPVVSALARAQREAQLLAMAQDAPEDQQNGSRRKDQHGAA
ncbi:peptide chain release factor 1 [Deinococcus wulumuqiensis]|uniref:Peptide chain release factor 1 n=1 Tax=Deinococcus wulumuqiensis TaxID=980427 RepID=A0AAV4K5A2_9DEIO|nr:peptide chain release factor 1 [Deinococcus wulumuqiensis]QII20570.1 peptide chain release factor 1 [Deinococcus wulumuqiensis R12]GGI72325.1 peptide chain release factor 1 [Deinococcus wulumuqiensis]GGP28520.1 peptide chain release factor 1 [Deinococcus wulumuqiensis]